MARTKLSKRGVITLPAEIRAAARLEEGDPIEVEIVEDGILLRPQKVSGATRIASHGSSKPCSAAWSTSSSPTWSAGNSAPSSA